MNTKEDKLNELARLLNIRENILLSTKQVLDVLTKPIVDDAEESLSDGAMIELGILMDRCGQKTLSLVDDMVKYSIAQYDRHFTEEDISAMVEFYGSPTGRRVVEVTPTVVKETIEQSVELTKGILDEVFLGENCDDQCE